MFPTVRFQIIVSLFVILVCTNNIVHSRSLYFETRNSQVKKLDQTLDAAATNVEGIPPSQIVALKNSLQACLASKHELLIKKFIVKILHVLDDMEYELAEEAKETSLAKRVNYFSSKDFRTRDVAKNLDKTLDFGGVFLSLLTPDQLKETEILTKKLNGASSKTKRDYFRIVTKYGNKCAAGIDFKLHIPSSTKFLLAILINFTFLSI